MTTFSTATDVQILAFFHEIRDRIITYDKSDNTISMDNNAHNDIVSIECDNTRWFDNTPVFQAKLFGRSNLAYCGVRNVFKLPEDWFVDVLVHAHLTAQAEKLNYNKRTKSDTGSIWY